MSNQVICGSYSKMSLAFDSMDSDIFFEDDRYIFNYTGQIDYSEEEIESLITRIINNPNSLRGGFAAACYDKCTQELLLIRDHLGIIPLYLCESPESFSFSTKLSHLRSIIGDSICMDDRWIADSISSIKSEKWRTPYTGISRILPGHCYKISGKECEKKSFWNLNSTLERQDLSYAEAVVEYKKLLLQAIKRVIGKTTIIGTELSGGLDSSGVTALANLIRIQKNACIFVFTHAFSEDSKGKFFPFNDETFYSKGLCRELDLSNHQLCTADEKGILQALRKNIMNQSAPTQQGYSMFSDVIYEQTKRFGIEKLLSGFGGDEGVSSPAKAYLLELEVKKDWKKYRETLFNSKEKVGFWYNVCKYAIVRYFPFLKPKIKRIISPDPDRLNALSFMAVNHCFEKQINVKENFRSERRQQKVKSLRELQLHKIMHKHVSQRFEYSFHNAASYGIEYVYPLWDIDLLEFYYSLPAEYKRRDGLGRAIFREAMKDILPENIRLRTDKSGATIPTIHQRFLFDYKEIVALISESKLMNQEHYLDYDKMLKWAERIKSWGSEKGPVLPGPFFNSLQILLLQQMERTGEFKSGIKY